MLPPELYRQGLRELQAKLDRLALRVSNDAPQHAETAFAVHTSGSAAVTASGRFVALGDTDAAMFLLATGEGAAMLLGKLINGEAESDPNIRALAESFRPQQKVHHHVN